MKSQWELLNKYGIVYKCSNEASGINSDQDFSDCDISSGDFGGLNQLSFTYSGAVTDTTVSSIIHRIFNGSDEIRFVTNIKSESECNSSTTDTTTGTDSDTYCTLDATLKPGSLDNQTVNSGSPISDIVYDIITDCTRVIHLVSSSGLPSGVSASIVNDDLKISGTPTLNSSR